MAASQPAQESRWIGRTGSFSSSYHLEVATRTLDRRRCVRLKAVHNLGLELVFRHPVHGLNALQSAAGNEVPHARRAAEDTKPFAVLRLHFLGADRADSYGAAFRQKEMN